MLKPNKYQENPAVGGHFAIVASRYNARYVDAMCCGGQGRAAVPVRKQLKSSACRGLMKSPWRSRGSPDCVRDRSMRLSAWG